VSCSKVLLSHSTAEPGDNHDNITALYLGFEIATRSTLMRELTALCKQPARVLRNGRESVKLDR
jgi:hypothetical protein